MVRDWEGLDKTGFHDRFNQNFWSQIIEEIIIQNLEEDDYWDCKERSLNTNKIIKFFSSFANCDSGILFFGISDSKPRKIIGIDEPENLIAGVRSIINSKTNFNSPIFAETVKLNVGSQEKNVVIFVIPKTPNVIQMSRKEGEKPSLTLYIRDGPSSIPLNPKNFGLLFKEKESIDNHSYPVLSIIQKRLGIFNINDIIEKAIKKKIKDHYKAENIQFLQIFHSWEKFHILTKESQIKEYQKYKDRYITITSLSYGIGGFFLMILVSLVILEIWRRFFYGRLEFLFFLFILLGICTVFYIYDHYFKKKEEDTSMMDQEIISRYFPQILYPTREAIDSLIEIGDNSKIFSEIHTNIAYMRFHMSPSKIRTLKNEPRSKRFVFTINPYFDPFAPRIEFEEWLREKNLNLEIPIPEDIVELSRIFSILIIYLLHGGNKKDVGIDFLKTEKEVNELLDKAFKSDLFLYDRYYYIFRLEKEY